MFGKNKNKVDNNDNNSGSVTYITAEGGTVVNGDGTAKKKKEHNAVYRALDKFFCFTERGTNIKTEIYAGILLFAEVICFMMVNAELLSDMTNITSFYTIYFMTVLITMLTSILIGVVCNAPFLQSTSLGLTTLIVSIYGSYSGLTYANIMALAMVSNIIYFVVMVIKPLREFIFRAVPSQVRKALPAALGMFLIVYVLVQVNVLTLNTADYMETLQQGAGESNPVTYFGLSYITYSLDFGDNLYSNWYTVMPVISGAIAFVIFLILKSFKVKHSTIISFGSGFLIYLIMWVVWRALPLSWTDYQFYSFIVPSYGSMYYYTSVSRILNMSEAQLIWKAFTSGFDFTSFTEAGGNVAALFATSIISFLILGVSETGAAVTGCGYITDSLDEDGHPEYISQPLFGKVGGYVNVWSVNALSSVLGCAVGAGPVVVRAENAVAASEGGKTGLTAIVGGLLFIIALFNLVFSGVFINGMVVYGIMVFVGLTMLTSVKNCDFTDFSTIISFMATVFITAVTLNLAVAVSVGIISDTLMKVLTRKFKSISAATWILTALMIVLVVLQLVL